MDNQRTMAYVIDTLETVNDYDDFSSYELQQVMISDCIGLLKEYYIKEFLGMVPASDIVGLTYSDVDEIGN